MLEQSGVLAGSVRARMPDSGTDADGECVLHVFGDGGEVMNEVVEPGTPFVISKRFELREIPQVDGPDERPH